MSQSLQKCARASVLASQSALRLVQSAQSTPFSSIARLQDSSSPPKPLPTTLNSLSEIENFLSKPSWSVRSLITPSSSSSDLPEITPKTLSHLLNLSALPQPTSPEQEASMLATLRSQLHFVREIQAVDTTGIKPLSAIREETEEAREEMTIGLERLREALGGEEVKGRMRRPRRRVVGEHETPEQEAARLKREREGVVVSDGGIEWKPLEMAPRTQGQYFVVETEGKVEPGS